MKEVPLTKGMVALVDDDDYDTISNYRWYAYKDGNIFYAHACIRDVTTRKKVFIKMHHLVIKRPVGMQIDHIDGDGLNNQKCNIRVVSHRLNQCNQHVGKSSRYPGVCFDKHAGKFVAGIKINGKRKSLGYFKDEFAAFQTYVVAAVVLVGESACPHEQEQPR